LGIAYGRGRCRAEVSMAEGSPEHSKYYEVSPLSRSRPALVKPRRDLLSILIEEARQRLPQRPVTHLYVVTRLGPSKASRGKWSIVSSAEQVPQSKYRRGPLPARRAVLTMAIRTDAIPTVAYAYRGYTHCGLRLPWLYALWRKVLWRNVLWLYLLWLYLLWRNVLWLYLL